MSGTSRADQFAASHAELLSHEDANPPLNTECPICLEGIEEHVCVKIVGIPGCNHLIGLECLMVFLKDHPNAKKSCPFCRTEWLPGTDDLADLPARVRSIMEALRRIEEESREVHEDQRVVEENDEAMREFLGLPVDGRRSRAAANQRADRRVADARRILRLDRSDNDQLPSPMFPQTGPSTLPGMFAQMRAISPFGQPHSGTERNNRANPPSSALYTDLPSFTGLGEVGVPRFEHLAHAPRHTSTSSARPHQRERSARDTAQSQPNPSTHRSSISNNNGAPTRRSNGVSGHAPANRGTQGAVDRPPRDLLHLDRQLQELGATVTNLTERFNAFIARNNERRGPGV